MGRTAKQGTEAEPIRRQSSRIPGARTIHQPTLYDLISRYRINSVLWEMVEF